MNEMRTAIIILVGELVLCIVAVPAVAADGINIIEEWNMTFGGMGDDYGYSVQQTTDGGYIIAGDTHSYGAGNADIWLIKTARNGDEQWNRTFGGTKADLLDRGSVRQTSDGGYIITGYTYSYGADNGSGWLIKTDQNGNEIWNRTFGGEGLDWGHSVRQTVEGGYIIAGRTEPYAGARADAWLIKTDSNGIEEWNRTFGADGCEYAASVQQTSDGGYIITGRTTSFGAGEADAWLIRTDSNGIEEWNRTFGGANYDYGYSVQQTTDGGFVIAGSTNGRQDAWLIKTDTNGIEEWNRIFGGPAKDESYSVQQTTDGGYIIAGYTESYGAGSADIWLIKTDSEGVEQWNRTSGGTGLEKGYSVLQTSDGGYIVPGYTNSFSTGGYDVWVIKLSPSLVWQYKELNMPFDAERLANNNTLVTTFGNHSVLEVSPDKQIVWRYGDGTAGSGANQLNCPADAEQLANNNTLITDRSNNRVIEVDRNKTIVWEMTGLNNPMDAERLSNGNTLIADRLNNRVIEVKPDKEIVWQYGISNPFDVERLHNNNTLIVEYTNHRVIEVNQDKEIVWQYGTGTPGSDVNQLNYPMDAERLSNNNTLITDSINHRVIKVNQDKEIVWQYGTGTAGSGANELNYPVDAERLSNNNTLITDVDNSRIIELVTLPLLPSPAPEIVSFAPLSTVYDSEGAVRTFNLTIDQVVNVSWLINGLIAQTNASVTEARYTNTSAKLGAWNVSAIASNPNGTVMQKWDWKVVTLLGPDLTVSMIDAYHYNTGESPWLNLSNEVEVKVENIGTATAETFNVSLYADDEIIGKQEVSGLEAGLSRTVQFKWTPIGEDCFTNCTFAYSHKDYNLTAIADCDNEVNESDEINNNLARMETAYYNGYMADEPLETIAHGTLRGGLTFTTGNGSYGGLYSVGSYRNTTYEITLPENATVTLARLNVYYTWQYATSCPEMEVSITTETETYVVPLEKSYNDIKCQCPGAPWVFPWGNYVYDITDYIQGSGTGTYRVTVKRTGGPSFCIAAPGIEVLYEDKNKPLIEYWIVEGADVLIGGRRGDGGYLSLEECINNATFPGNIDPDKVRNATLGVVSLWAGSAWLPEQTNYLFFNDITLGQGVYYGYDETYDETIDGISMHIGSTNAQVGVNVTDVTDYLQASDNRVGQGDDGDNMMPTNAFLVVEYDTTPPASITNLSYLNGTTWINWTWTNPPDADFNYTRVYLNGTWQANTLNPFYTATGLSPDTLYEIGTRAVDEAGNVNATWVNGTAKTLILSATHSAPPRRPGGGAAHVHARVAPAINVPIEPATGAVTSTTSLNTERATLTIPAGTIVKDVAGNPLSTSLTTLYTKTIAESIGAITAHDLGPGGTTFTPSIALTIKYDPAEIPAGMSESDLVIKLYDGTTWISLDTTVDTAMHTTTAKVSHFTIFALFAEKTVLLPTPTPTPAPTIALPSATPTPAPVLILPLPTLFLILIVTAVIVIAGISIIVLRRMR